MGKILIVDDSKTVRSLIKSTLSNLGFNNYQFEEAEDGQSALDALRRETFNLITTDLEMPTMDGLALCKNMLADRVLSKIPLIVISAMSNAEKAEFIKLGIKRIIFKPIQKEQLEGHLKELFPLVFSKPG